MNLAKSECCEPRGKCCANAAPGINRRDFIKTAAVTAGALSALESNSDTDQSKVVSTSRAAKGYERSRETSPRVYRAAELTHIAMPMGGIGAGQVYIRGDGRLGPWQILNNFNANAQASDAFFAISTRTDDGKRVVRCLQEGDVGALRGVTAVEFSGEYPYAWVRYLDGQLPVSVSMEAFSPFIPLNPKDSGLPAVVFRFTVQNPSSQSADIALAASMPNLVGWDGYAPLNGPHHDEFMGNFNALEDRDKMTLLHMQTRAGEMHRLSKLCELVTNDGAVAYQMRLCENLRLHFLQGRPIPKTTDSTVYWLGNISGSVDEPNLEQILNAVAEGAALVVAGAGDTLLALADQAKSNPGETTVFEDWESGTYGKWSLSGDCFGAAPVTDTLPNQQKVSGWRGKYYVNTYVGTDVATGRAISRPFKIGKRFIHLLVGGGQHPNETCVNLVIGNDVVATATGENTERLRPVRWDVAAHLGKTARIEIVDTHQGGWGHILVDDIVFSDSPASPFVNPALAQRAREVLPFTWNRAQLVEAPVEIKHDSPLLAGIQTKSVRAGQRWQFEAVRLKDGAQVLLEAADGSPLVIAGKYGKGAVVVCNGMPLDWVTAVDKKTLAGNILVHTTGTSYSPQTGWSETSPHYGSMALGVLHDGVGSKTPDDISAMQQWIESPGVWDLFDLEGKFPSSSEGPSSPGQTWNGALSASFKLKPGEERRVTFLLTWHFPNRTRDGRYGWGPGPYQYDHRLGNQYNNWFKNAAEVADYVATNFERLDRETRLFHETFYDSSLPRWFLDALTANIATIRSPVYIWLEDGFFGGFEGADSCCPMNCTHVYNYAMSTAYMFPSLERNVRDTDLKVQMHPTEHYIPHRTILPLSLPRLQNEIGGPHHHALDGELGTILKTYREWKLCGDRDWVAGLWRPLKKVMQHVMRDHDVDGDGVIKGEQPNTYDTHAFGSNTFIGTLYLAALRATEELAKITNDAAFAQECRARFERGREGYDRICWNGEYYYNVFDAPNADPSVYNQSNCWGPGCHSDQLLGQWWAHCLGLGYVLPEEHVRQALQAIYKNNWREDLSNHSHHQRVFAEGKEKGLLCCSWPRGGRPDAPILYCDEVWTGLEYHVAATLFYEGRLEALGIVKGARDRYTGNPRNPWAEIECGYHYARAMSAHSLLTAAAGFDYDADSGTLTMAPAIGPDDFQCFFNTAAAWGSLAQERPGASEQINRIQVKYGELTLRQFRFKFPEAVKKSVSLSTIFRGKDQRHPNQLNVDGLDARLVFDPPIIIHAEDQLQINMNWA
ncbi:MAG: twin-arginine translocation signal domain-containing protein [Candidatus Hydrogenedentes bacterium]|nr:twin-arginine translocation signal domain-containing protein [Candidatus Hydrogenedentota bacterium]